MLHFLFEPNYSSAISFPRCSHIPCCAPPGSQCRRCVSSPTSNDQEHKRVRFLSSNENQVYWIQRRDSQKLSIRTEALLNRIAITQQLIQNLREEMNVLGKVESELNTRNDQFLVECANAGLGTALDAQAVRSVLDSRLYHLDLDIEHMLEDTLQLKEETKRLLASTAQTLRNQQTIARCRRLVLSKRSLDVLESLLMEHEHLRASGRVYGSKATHTLSPESEEATARCA
jgi:hypothetical protein